jgi:nucleotide-binding universal stress UspA family protein
MFKSILAHLTATDCDQPVLSTSLQLASTCAGHIDCLRVNPDLNAVATQIEQTGMAGWITLSDRLSAMETEAKERTKTAQAAFASFCRNERIQNAADPPGPGAVSCSWLEETGEELERIMQLSRHHDTVVIAGGADRAGRLPQDVMGAIVIGSGRPVIFAPETQHSGDFNVVAVAWKDTAEAARAVTAAMPLLKRAQRIEVFSATEANNSVSETELSHEGILQYFRWHGLNVTSHLLAPAMHTSSEAVLDAVNRAGADLLIMGAYGHTRLRELLFGGFTRHVLRGANLPIFMFH